MARRWSVGDRSCHWCPPRFASGGLWPKTRFAVTRRLFRRAPRPLHGRPSRALVWVCVFCLIGILTSLIVLLLLLLTEQALDAIVQAQALS
jgi:hypothetical protein